MHRAIPLAVFIAFLFCYLEWGHRGAFVFQMEYDILFSGDTEASAFLHPAIAIPLAGQVILLICSFRKHPNRRWVLGGVLLLSCLVLLIFLAGLLSMRAGDDHFLPAFPRHGPICLPLPASPQAPYEELRASEARSCCCSYVRTLCYSLRPKKKQRSSQRQLGEK